MPFAVDAVEDGLHQLSTKWAHGLAKMPHESEPIHEPLLVGVGLLEDLDLVDLEEDAVFIESLHRWRWYFLEVSEVEGAGDIGVVAGHGAVDGAEVGGELVLGQLEPDFEEEAIGLGVELHSEERHFYYYLLHNRLILAPHLISCGRSTRPARLIIITMREFKIHITYFSQPQLQPRSPPSALQTFQSLHLHISVPPSEVIHKVVLSQAVGFSFSVQAQKQMHLRFILSQKSKGRAFEIGEGNVRLKESDLRKGEIKTQC